MMYLSSGYVDKLLAGKGTEGHKKLIQMFISGERPIYNAKASPIDAFRIGAILEDRFYLTLDEDYLPQYVVWSDEYSFCKSTLDFAKVKANKVVSFKELKTCFFTDFLKFQEYKKAPYRDYLKFLKSNYKNNYNQVQYQMFCTGLEEAELIYLEVKNYNDDDNLNRIIQEDEYIGFKIYRDEEVINEIRNRLRFFESIVEYINNK